MKKILSSLFLFFVATNLLLAQATGLVISDKATGGSIGAAAVTVDAAVSININQSTADQILTVPNLTASTAGKIIYVNNIGTVPFTLFPGGYLSVGTGVTLRWDGSRWNVCGNGNPIGAVGPPGPAGPAGATGATGPTGPAGGVNSVTSSYAGLVISPTTGNVVATLDTATYVVSKNYLNGALASKLNTSSFTDALISTSDITTNNVSITKHGFVPKAPNDATKYLDGTGAWTVPAGGGGSSSLANANIFVGNASDVATAVPVSGVLTLANTGAFSFASTTGTGATVQATTPTFVTNITTPLILGGTAAGSNITYTSTTGTGTAAGVAHGFKGGTNGGTNLLSLLNDGSFIVGNTTQLSAENFSFQKNANSNTQFTVYNTTAGNAGRSSISALLSGNAGISMRAHSTSFTTSGIDVQTTSVLSGNQAGGMNIGTTSNSQLSFWTNNTLRANYGASGGLFIGGSTTPLALLHIGAGTTALPPFLLTSGTNTTTAVNGAFEYNGTNLFFTRAGAVRENVITSSAVNSVTPTSPNRTITVVIDGVTYYIAAKTTND